MFTLLHQCYLSWLGHIHRMEEGCIPKDLHFGELATGARCRGCPQLCYKDVCKHDMKACNIHTESWEAFADGKTLWKQQVSQGLNRGEVGIQEKKWWKTGQENSQSSAGPPGPTSSICLHMPGLQQRLQIQDWPLQPYKTMLISYLSGCYSIVDQLMDANSILASVGLFSAWFLMYPLLYLFLLTIVVHLQRKVVGFSWVMACQCVIIYQALE